MARDVVYIGVYRPASGQRLVAILFTLALLFPQFPLVVKTSYTQPSLLVYFVLVLLPLVLFKFGCLDGKIIRSGALIGLWVLTYSVFALYHGHVAISKVFGLSQGLLAGFAGFYFGKLFVRPLIAPIVAIYFLSAIYSFGTGGVIESYLFSGSTEGSTPFEGGRGAAPLSPEPGYFVDLFAALALFLIITGEKRPKFYLAISCLMLATFSVSGLIFGSLLLIVCFHHSVKRVLHRFVLYCIAMVIGIVAIIAVSSIDIQGVRSLIVLQMLLDTGSFSGDQSVATRIEAVEESLQFIRQHPMGAGFSRESLGGWLYLAEVFGWLVFPVLVFFFIAAIATAAWPANLFIFIWILYHALAGFVLIPFVFFVFGLAASKWRPRPIPGSMFHHKKTATSI